MQVWVVDAGQVETSVGFLFAEHSGFSQGLRVQMNSRRRVVHSRMLTPRDGWPAFWQHLRATGAFAIRNESELGQRSGAIHGIRIIFMHHEHGRTNHGSYNNPQSRHRPEQQSIMSLMTFLGDQIHR